MFSQRDPNVSLLYSTIKQPNAFATKKFNNYFTEGYRLKNIFKIVSCIYKIRLEWPVGVVVCPLLTTLTLAEL